MKLGVSGGIGSGKSTVCLILSALGARVFDSDSVAKSLYLEADIRIQIEEILGSEVYSNGRLDSALMAERVFSNRELLKQVEGIIHPEVRARWKRFSQDAQDEGFNSVMESALLFERGRPEGFDCTIWVSAPEEIRIQRAMKRSALSRAQVLERMNRQKSERELMSLADELVLNDGIHLLLPQVWALWNRLNSRR